jgi:hypothetical protein
MRRTDICVRGRRRLDRWSSGSNILQSEIQHPLSKTVTRPHPSTQLPRFTFQVAGKDGEMRKSVPSSKWAGQRRRNCRSPVRYLDRGRCCWKHGWDGQVAKCRQTQSLLTSNSATSSPSHAWQNELDALGLVRIVFTRWRGGVRQPMVSCSGRSHGLSSAWMTG